MIAESRESKKRFTCLRDVLIETNRAARFNPSPLRASLTYRSKHLGDSQTMKGQGSSNLVRFLLVVLLILLYIILVYALDFAISQPELMRMFLPSVTATGSTLLMHGVKMTLCKLANSL
jgi:hypothetical protein